MIRRFVLPCCLIFSVVFSANATAQNAIRGATFGVTAGQVTGVTHALNYTMGQSTIATGLGATHTVQGGFWGAGLHITATDPLDTPELPAFNFLHQNLPNPFNPTTTIAYDLAGAPGPVSLRLYDVAGHLVRTLVNENQGMGRYSIVWRGRDDSGREVASGVYLYVLTTPKSQFTKKMVLLR